jgi:hypothetical protein
MAVAVAAASALMVLAWSAQAFDLPNDANGHTHVAGTIPDQERCGTYLSGGEGSGVQTNPAGYDYVSPSPLGIAGAAQMPDHNWVHDTDADLVVYDMGRDVTSADLIPSIDHGPVPGEAIEVTVYGGPSPTGPWTVADVTTVFDQGFDAAWVSDDYATRWALAAPARYIAFGHGGPKAIVDDGDAEIDALCAPNQQPSCSNLTADPGTLWPPNHKLREVTVSGATDPDGDTVTLTVTGVTQDEALNGVGDGDTSPDAAAGSASNKVKVRAERSGTGDGRVYVITVSGDDGHGGTCTGTATVGVPHDQGGGSVPVNSGQTVNSFGP